MIDREPLIERARQSRQEQGTALTRISPMLIISISSAKNRNSGQTRYSILRVASDQVHVCQVVATVTDSRFLVCMSSLAGEGN